jgi:hypothetical protein
MLNALGPPHLTTSVRLNAYAFLDSNPSFVGGVVGEHWLRQARLQHLRSDEVDEIFTD